MNTKSLHLRRSCIANFKTFYGIGTIKAKSLSRFLLTHPTQDQFTINFDLIRYPTTDSDIWVKIPRDNKIRHLVQHFFQIKFEAFCYQSLRLFQNLPTKGQRTKANGNAILNSNPYKNLQVDLPLYDKMLVLYKRLELKENGRYDELKTYTEAQEQKEKMHKQDEKQRKLKAKQDYFKKQRLNKK